MTSNMETNLHINIPNRCCPRIQLRDWHYWFYRPISHFKCPLGRSHRDGYAIHERDGSAQAEHDKPFTIHH